ncbi:hypothetical protein VC178_02415 [Polynucleobacter sp. AP-Sanab-80-C2]|uniref:hypothetical protein n=1 Tax=Polynucleobacter sp. AP-Sanab-80-C2 TaxID=3108274 RepID=UPI002B237B11|nr:hypothetical protein [Polynucleobacter sp. AP-Sanab-80-C2]MEA9598750.1 hypothetical protein [Polynucleobacter sp. AP-Sanab-80-C2]
MMAFEKSPDYYLQALFKANQSKSAETLFHRVEHAGFGAITSRLMTGLNISLALDANYSYLIDSPYVVEEMFDIGVKQSIEIAKHQELIEWDFMRDTWNAQPQIKADHQYPASPIKECAELSRHQWCAVLAQAICGAPSATLYKEIDALKNRIHWNSYDVHIGLHVRRGDKNSECPYVPNESYLREVRGLIFKNPQKKILVFLSSDDPNAIEHIQTGLIGVDVRWDDCEARYNNFNAGMVAANPELALQESITAAKNISLLGECNYVIGMRHAQFTWLGGLLAVFNHGLDASIHIMLDPYTGFRSHWAILYGFPLSTLLL